MAEVCMMLMLAISIYSIFLAVLPRSANLQDAVKAALEVCMILTMATVFVIGVTLVGILAVYLLQLAGFSVGGSQVG